jgi:hypothetical protein
MYRARLALIALSAAAAGCGGGSGPSAVPKPVLSAPGLIRSPPIRQLSAEQLRSLSMECEKYSPDPPRRGPYDAAYCEEAIAAWSDSPLQIVNIDQGIAAPVAPAGKQTDPSKTR